VRLPGPVYFETATPEFRSFFLKTKTNFISGRVYQTGPENLTVLAIYNYYLRCSFKRRDGEVFWTGLFSKPSRLERTLDLKKPLRPSRAAAASTVRPSRRWHRLARPLVL
jgi:hypothetical protein